MLTNYRSDDSPLLGSSDCAVSECRCAADYTVVTYDVFLRFDDNWTLVPDERLLKYFKDLLVQDRSLDTRYLPLMFSN